MHPVVLGTKAQLFGYAAASRLADTTGSIASSKFEATQVGGIGSVTRKTEVFRVRGSGNLSLGGRSMFVVLPCRHLYVFLIDF